MSTEICFATKLVSHDLLRIAIGGDLSDFQFTNLILDSGSAPFYVTLQKP